MARIKKLASGGKSALGMKSVKAGFDKNPGVTRADIIVAAKKEAKYGKKVKKAKKAQDGTDVELRTGQLKRLGRLSAKNPRRAKKVAKRIVERATRERRGEQYLKKNVSKFMPGVPEVKAKKGASVKGKIGKCRYGCK